MRWSWLHTSLSNVRLLNINRLILILWMREMSSNCRRPIKWVMCGPLILITNSVNLSRSTRWSNRLLPLTIRRRSNPQAMASSTLKIAWSKLLSFWNGMPTRRLANLGCRFRRTISIWSCYLGQSSCVPSGSRLLLHLPLRYLLYFVRFGIIPTIFAL